MDESFRLWHHGGTYTFTVGFADGEPDRTRHVLERLFFAPDAHVSAVLVAVAAAARGSSLTRRGPLDEATKDELRWAIFSRWLAVTYEPAPRFAAGAGGDARPAARRGDDAMADAAAAPPPIDTGSRAPVTTWIELVLVDQHGLPVANRGYRVCDAGGSERSGTLGATGRVLLQGLTPGVAEVTCPADPPFAARDHVVLRGEHLAAIADRHGYDGVGVIWDHPDNVALRALRKDPNVLLEGDVVHLPERRSRSVPRATGAEHTFVVERTPLELRLLLESFTAKPIAGAALAPAPAPLHGRDATAADGSVAWTISAGTPRVAIQLLGEDTELSVGSLDPIDQDQGRAARLVNLGYLADDPEEPDDDALELAVELFQADAGLAITGLLDAAGASKLHALHGVLSGIRAMTEDASIISAEHPVKHRLSLYVAPTTEEKSNRLRVPLVAVACWRMGDALFEFDSSFVLPAAKRDLPRLARLVEQHPDSPLSVFGHADPVGDDGYNKTLSGRRARAVYAMLLRDVVAWEDLYRSPMPSDRWGTPSIQRMLGEVLAPSGHPYHPGGASGVLDATTIASVRSFQSDNGLKADGDPGPATRKALFRAYMDALCEDLVLTPAQFLGEGADPDGKAALQGCGEFNPVLLFSRADTKRYASGKDKAQRDQRNARNRRVVIFLWRAGTRVDPAEWPCPTWKASASGCKASFWPDGEQRRAPGEDERWYGTDKHTMACKHYDRHARLSPCEGWRGAPKQVSVFLDDATTGPVADTSVDLVFGDGTKDRKTTDGDGMLVLWARHGDHADATYAMGTRTTTVRLFLRPPDASSEDGAWQRLANLGYTIAKPAPPSPDRPDAMLGALQAFQAESDLPITDALDAATARALEEAHDRDRSAWRVRHSTGDPSPGPGDANVKASVT